MDSPLNEVADFYKSLEEINSIDIWDISLNIKYTGSVEGRTLENIITERKVLSLNFNNGRLISSSQLTNVSGKVESLLCFDKKELGYIEGRLSETNNVFMKGRYSNILWQETKNNKYAVVSLESYIKLIDNTEDENLENVLPFLEAVLYISKVAKKNLDQVKNFVVNYLNTTEKWFKVQVLSLIISSNAFSKNELNQFGDDILTWLDNDNYFLNKHILEVALSLFKKVGKQDNEVYNLLAKNQDLILKNHLDESSFFRTTSMGDKALYYKKAKNVDEYNKTIAEFNRIKQKTKFYKFSNTLSRKNSKTINDLIAHRAKIILNHSPEEILVFFACDESVLVDPQEIRDNLAKKARRSISDLYTISMFDRNLNYKRLTEKEKKNQEFLDNYTVAINLEFYALFIKVFMEAIIQGKLNYYIVLDYFEKHTWYSETIKLRSKEEITNSYSWISMIAPGMHSLFSQFELSVLMNTNKINNFILAIDSLTIKFEGALRDFIKLNGGNTTGEKRGELKEQLLEELIENPTAKEYFSERDVALFKYTFTSSGKNIRNDVAHSFFMYPAYTLQNAILVFFCLLRLGKFEILSK